MKEKKDELKLILEKLILMLESDGQINWSHWLKKSLTIIDTDVKSSINHLLAAYGGMGSLNDTYLSKITKENDQFSSMRTKAWELAMELKIISTK